MLHASILLFQMVLLQRPKGQSVDFGVFFFFLLAVKLIGQFLKKIDFSDTLPLN